MASQGASGAVSIPTSFLSSVFLKRAPPWPYFHFSLITNERFRCNHDFSLKGINSVSAWGCACFPIVAGGDGMPIAGPHGGKDAVPNTGYVQRRKLHTNEGALPRHLETPLIDQETVKIFHSWKHRFYRRTGIPLYMYVAWASEITR